MGARKKSIESRIAIPAHAKRVDNSLNGFWKPENEGDALQGVVGDMVEAKGADGRPNVFYMVKLTSAESAPIIRRDDKGVEQTVEAEVGMLVGVGGRMLATFFAQNKGEEAILVYKGLGAKKPGKNPPKLYETYLLNEHGEE